MKKLGLVILLLCSFSTFSQSKLKSAKDSFKDSESGKYITPSEVQYSSSSADETSLLSLFPAFFELSFILVYSVAIESPFEADSPMHKAELQPYPFYGKQKGDYSYQPLSYKPYRFEVSNSYFNETDRLQANDFRLKFRFAERFAVSGSYHHFWERPVKGNRERLDIIITTFDYYRIRTPKFAMHWGIGAGYIGNEVNQFGVAFSVGSELYFRPLSIDVSYKYASFSNNDISIFEAGPKYHLKQYFIQLKYQNYGLGRERVSGFSAGLGIYF